MSPIQTFFFHYADKYSWQSEQYKDTNFSCCSDESVDPYPWSEIGEWDSPCIKTPATRGDDLLKEGVVLLQSMRAKIRECAGHYILKFTWHPTGETTGYFHISPQQIKRAQL